MKIIRKYLEKEDFYKFAEKHDLVNKQTNNQQLIKKITAFQNCNEFHPLTCGNNSNHNVLEEKEVEGKVVLICPDCDYVQEYIPHFLLTTNKIPL